MASSSNPIDVRELPLDRLEPNPWNPNRMSRENLARLRRELERGFLAPLLVRPLPAGRFQIVDGEHRFRLARELGLAAVPCAVKDLSLREAKIKTLQLNGLRGENDPTLLARLLDDLRADLSPQKLAQLLPWSAAEIEAMVSLACQNLERETRINAARMTSLERELYAVVLPRGGREEVEAALADARRRLGLADEGAALLAVCRQYRDGLPARLGIGGGDPDRPSLGGDSVRPQEGECG